MTKRSRESTKEIKHFFRDNNGLNRGHASKVMRTFDSAEDLIDQEEDTLQNIENGTQDIKVVASKYSKAAERVFLMIYILCLSLGASELFLLKDNTAGYITWFTGLSVILLIYYFKSKCHECTYCKNHKKT